MTTTYIPVSTWVGQLLAAVTEATVALRRDRHGIPEPVVALVDSLAEVLHADAPESIDLHPSFTAPLFAGALRASEALRLSDRPAARANLRIALEQVRHALRDIDDEAPVAEPVDVAQVLRRLVDELGLPQSELAPLLGISTRQLQRWLAAGGPSPSGHDEARVRTVARLVNQLRHSFTAPGVPAWFRREHPQLGAAPIDLLDDPLDYPRLLAAARGARSAPG